MTTPERPRRIFPVTGAKILFTLVTVLVVALLVDAAVRSGIGNALLIAPWPLLVLWLTYTAGIASDIRADESGVRVQNVLRRTWMPWQQVTRIALRWQLEITLADGAVVRCFGGPVRSRPRRLGPGRTKEESSPADDGIAALQRLRLSAQGTDGPVRRSWDVTSLAVLAALVVWAVVAVLVTR